MSELQKMEAPPAYDTTTTPAPPVYDKTTHTTIPDPAASTAGQNTVVTVTTTAPTTNGGQYTYPVRNVSAPRRYQEEDSVNAGALVLSVCCCTLLGLLALYFNFRAKEHYNSGSYEEGRQAVRNARITSIIAIVLGLLLGLAGVGLGVAQAILQQQSLATTRRTFTFNRSG